MKRATAASLVLASTISGGCHDEPMAPSHGGAIALAIAWEDANLASTTSAASEGACEESSRDLDQARIYVEGPIAKSVPLTASPDSFYGTVDSLPEGDYAVRVVGLVDGEVDHYGETQRDVNVMAGRTSIANVSFQCFRPSLNSVPALVSNLAFDVCYDAVPHAESYRVEWAASASFASQSSGDTTATCYNIEVATPGRYLVRVRAAKAVLSERGAASDADSVDVVQSNWVQLNPIGGPPSPRRAHATVYNGTFDGIGTMRMTVYGGVDAFNGLFGDVWILTDADGLGGTPNWIQAQPLGGPPPPRRSHSAVYDPISNRMIVFGGIGPSGSLNDLWVLANADGVGGTPTWTELTPTGDAPSPRQMHTAVYRPGTTKRMIVFGGVDANNRALSDVWILVNPDGIDGTPAWIRLSPGGDLPPARWAHTAVYASGSNSMIVFGGREQFPGSVLNDLWVLTHADGVGGTPIWSQLQPTGSRPPPRQNHSAAYDPSNRMVIFGGLDSSTSPSFMNLNDAWVLIGADGTGETPEWVQLLPEGLPPPSRDSHTGVYDFETNRMIIFGGVQSGDLFSDVWVLTRADGEPD